MLNETFNNIPVEQETLDEDTIVYTAGSNGKPLLASIEKEFNLNQIIRKFYQQDKMYSKILENPKAHAKFGVKEGLIFTKNNLSQDVICISPKAIHKGKRLIEIHSLPIPNRSWQSIGLDFMGPLPKSNNKEILSTR